MSLKSETEATTGDINKSQIDTYQIRPAQRQKFKTSLAKEIIQEILIKHLKDKTYKEIDVNILPKIIANEIQNKLKDHNSDGLYKFVANVFIAERLGAGIMCKACCVWDVDLDISAFDQFLNETIVCAAVVFAVYYY